MPTTDPRPADLTAQGPRVPLAREYGLVFNGKIVGIGFPDHESARLDALKWAKGSEPAIVVLLSAHALSSAASSRGQGRVETDVELLTAFLVAQELEERGNVHPGSLPGFREQAERFVASVASGLMHEAVIGEEGRCGVPTCWCAPVASPEVKE